MLFGKTLMKRTSLLLMLILWMTAAGLARQTSGIEISVQSGIALPASPMSFSDYWKFQYGGGLSVGYPLSSSVTLLGSFEYHRFNLNEDGVHSGFDTEYMRRIWILDGVSMNPSADPGSVLSVSANVRIAPLGLSGRLSPYFVAGVGIARFSLSDIELPTTSVLSVNNTTVAMTANTRIIGTKETVLSVQGGVGFDYRIAEPFSLFVEGRYAVGLTKGESSAYVPLGVGLKMHL